MFYFTPLSGFFSPFPHGTGTLSVSTEYLALEDGPPSFRQGFSCPALLTNSSARSNAFIYGTFTLYGAAFQPASISDRFSYSRSEIRLRDGCRTTPHVQRPNACTRTV